MWGQPPPSVRPGEARHESNHGTYSQILPHPCHAERSSEGAKRPHREVEASLPPANCRSDGIFDVAFLGWIPR